MSPELVEKLNQEYSEITPKIFYCDDGWYNIISSVFFICQKRNLKDFKFVQIKEKFGGLRMYSEGSDEFISGVVRCAEELSYKTCEITGEPGFLCVKNNRLLKTLSENKMKELGFEKYKK